MDNLGERKALFTLSVACVGRVTTRMLVIHNNFSKYRFENQLIGFNRVLTFRV